MNLDPLSVIIGVFVGLVGATILFGLVVHFTSGPIDRIGEDEP